MKQSEYKEMMNEIQAKPGVKEEIWENLNSDVVLYHGMFVDYTEKGEAGLRWDVILTGVFSYFDCWNVCLYAMIIKRDIW